MGELLWDVDPAGLSELAGSLGAALDGIDGAAAAVRLPAGAFAAGAAPGAGADFARRASAGLGALGAELDEVCAAMRAAAAAYADGDRQVAVLLGGAR